MARGRPRKPTVLHVTEGTFKNAKHGDRLNEPQPDGELKMPSTLSPNAKRFWRRRVTQLKQLGLATSADRESLSHLAELWASWLVAAEAVRANPLDRDARLGFIQYGAEFSKLGARFGLTPADRAKLTVAPKDAKEDDTEARYFG